MKHDKMFQMLFILQSLGVHLLGAETLEPEEENSVAAWNLGGSPHWHHAGSRHCCTCNDHRHSCVGGPQGKRTISLKGSWGCLMSPPVWNVRAVISFLFTISSLVLLPSLVTLSFLFCLLVRSPDHFPENSSVFFVQR